MAFLIVTYDNPGSGAIRDTHRAAHYAFLARHAPRLLASGGLQDDGGSPFHGAAILLDVDSQAEAEAFVAEDPFNAAGLFASISIERWKPAYLNGRRLEG